MWLVSKWWKVHKIFHKSGKKCVIQSQLWSIALNQNESNSQHLKKYVINFLLKNLFFQKGIKKKKEKTAVKAGEVSDKT